MSAPDGSRPAPHAAGRPRTGRQPVSARTPAVTTTAAPTTSRKGARREQGDGGRGESCDPRVHDQDGPVGEGLLSRERGQEGDGQQSGEALDERPLQDAVGDQQADELDGVGVAADGGRPDRDPDVQRSSLGASLSAFIRPADFGARRPSM